MSALAAFISLARRQERRSRPLSRLRFNFHFGVGQESSTSAKVVRKDLTQLVPVRALRTVCLLAYYALGDQPAL